MKESLFIIKIGGNIIDEELKLSSFLKDFASITGKKILVHGGGKLATQLAGKLGIEQTMIDGRRITDAETLKVVTMVYAGLINKNIVAQLQSLGCNAIGLTGADGNAILAHKRKPSNPQSLKRSNEKSIDYGFAGDIDKVNDQFFSSLLKLDYAPIVSPITHDANGQLLNTNADTIAQELAKRLSKEYNVSLIYSFEKNGVLLDVNDENSVIKKIGPSEYETLKNPPSGGRGAVFAGMIPKLDNAFTALNSGVSKVIIGKAENLKELVEGNSGTTITNG